MDVPGRVCLPVCKIIQPDVVIYHQGCPDGIAGAWPFWREGNKEKMKFMQYNYGQPTPVKEDIKDKIIAMVDFCFDRDVMLRILESAKMVVVLDHHLSTQRQIKGIEKENFELHFDLERSAAQICWEYVYGTVCPWFINVIADRDLWKWTLPYSREVSKALYVKNYYNFGGLDNLLAIPQNEIPNTIRFFSSKGEIFLRKEEKEILSAVHSSVLCEMTTPSGKKYRVRLTSCKPSLRSEVGNRLASSKGCEFAALWNYDFLLDEWWISLRGSPSNNIDLSQVCEEFHRGGGHFNAASFALRGADNQKLQNYFRVLEVPLSRRSDALLVNF
jgi:uncharacterized protein